MAADAKKFHDVWCMNEEELKELGLGVIEADKVIHEQQLGLSYQSPDMYVCRGAVFLKQVWYDLIVV